jgi:CheY-like chemotaxis protein
MDFIAENQSSIKKIPRLRILVVDDDVLNQRMMQLLLMRDGHQVDLAFNGLEAFETIKIQEYDVVFMDLQMPVMDGIEASRRIRAWENGGKHTFIVALTASYLPEQGQVLFEAGIDNYVSKPFQIEQVQQLLKYGFQSRLTSSSDQSEKLAQGVRPEKVLDIQKGIVQVGGDEEMYKELLSDFIEGLPKRLWTLQQFCANKDWVELSRAAHNLRGIAANLGASELSVYAKKLDNQSIEGYTDTLDSLIREIQLVIGKLLEVSNNFLAEKKISVGSA